VRAFVPLPPRGSLRTSPHAVSVTLDRVPPSIWHGVWNCTMPSISSFTLVAWWGLRPRPAPAGADPSKPQTLISHLLEPGDTIDGRYVQTGCTTSKAPGMTRIFPPGGVSPRPRVVRLVLLQPVGVAGSGTSAAPRQCDVEPRLHFRHEVARDFITDDITQWPLQSRALGLPGRCGIESCRATRRRSACS
jgi:hypothetical protein